MRALAASAGVEAPSVRWRYAHDKPWFDNQVATLELDGRKRALRAREDRAARGRGSRKTTSLERVSSATLA